ncbi:hypothetical protein C8R45DRAFT_823377, partial [Mycena sanguinolenta]
MEAPSRAASWKEIKRLADPKPAPISVTADELKDVFEKRLNPPTVLPLQFDSAQHKINKILATLIPEKTEDKTPEGFFTRIWTEDDMGRLKAHIRTHSLDSTPGEDCASYVDLLEIPNEDLAYLANQCVEKGDGPTICCFLKAMTILIHWRIADWAKARSLIPPCQNGFRPGYRTNNNPFILRCAKEWARAHGYTLYVAAVDATNTFPSTDQPTLWLKLFRLGMGSAIFD